MKLHIIIVKREGQKSLLFLFYAKGVSREL